MKQPKVFVEDTEVHWTHVAEGVTRKIMAFNDQIMLVRVRFKKGGIGSLHHHYHSQVTHIESGSFEVIIDGNKKVLNAGDAFYIPPNTNHGCVCLQDGVLIDVFSPMREDFVGQDGNDLNAKAGN
jgi:quercetin dioxygenase-like cupin family protein